MSEYRFFSDKQTEPQTDFTKDIGLYGIRPSAEINKVYVLE
jgi:hypothetical protein